MTSSERSILFICDFNAHGGTQTHLLHLIGALDRTRFRPRLAALTLHPELSRRLVALDVEVIDLALTGALRPATFRAALSLARRARREVDLLHGYLHQGNVLTAAISTASGVPCITSVRNEDRWKHGGHRLASALAHRRARRVLFNSARVRDLTVRRERIPADRTVLIPNGVPDPGPQRLAPEPGADGGQPRALCVASLRAKKGHRHLLEAFRAVRRRLPEARLVLAGEGPLDREISALAGEPGLAGSVELLGFRTDVPALMARSDLFVLASLEEGMPNALLEAMACGLPCVVTDVGGNAEVVEEGRTGHLVPPGRPDLLAERIAALLADPDGRRRMGERARLRFEAGFSLDRMIEAYHRLYEGALAGERAR